MNITPNYQLKSLNTVNGKIQSKNNTQLTFGMTYKQFNGREFLLQNKNQIRFAGLLTSILAVLGIRKKTDTEKALFDMAIAHTTDNEEKQKESIGKYEDAILSDMEKSVENMQETNDKYYAKHPEIRAQIATNIASISEVINSDQRLYGNSTMKSAVEFFELQQLNFSKDKNIGIDKMTDKANAQVRFMKEYLNNSKLNTNEGINKDLYQTIDLIDSNRQVDFILKRIDKYQDNLSDLVSVSWKLFNLNEQKQPSDEFVERFVNYISRKDLDEKFYNNIYRRIKTPENLEDEKKITRAIDLYFGGAMPFEKMYDIINEIGCLEK